MTAEMKTKKPDRPEWPAGKPIPSFKSQEEEEAFCLAYSFDDVMDATGEELNRAAADSSTNDDK